MNEINGMNGTNELTNQAIKQWVTLSFRNIKVLHRSVTSNLKSNCWTLV